MNAETERRMNELEQALARLAEALREPDSNPLWLDGTIQRFEFTFELFWKVTKRLLDAEGIDARTPREVLQRAYQAGWLDDEETWSALLRARNATSHTYNEATALSIYETVRTALPEMQRAVRVLARRVRGT